MRAPEQKICNSASNCSSDLLSANAKATLFLLTSSQHNALQQEQLASQCLFPAPGDFQRPKSFETGPPLILSKSNSQSHGDSPLLMPDSGPESGCLSPLEFGDTKLCHAKLFQPPFSF